MTLGIPLAPLRFAKGGDSSLRFGMTWVREGGRFLVALRNDIGHPLARLRVGKGVLHPSPRLPSALDSDFRRNDVRGIVAIVVRIGG